jgi:hypothetical protein
MKFSSLFDDNEANPFQSPQETEGAAGVDANRLTRDEKFAILGRLFWQWEKLRIAYNVVLVIEVVVLTVTIVCTRAETLKEVGRIRFGEFLVVGCLAANLLFLLGHYINAYLAWFGFRQRIYTQLIYYTGLALAMILAAVALAIEVMPKF